MQYIEMTETYTFVSREVFKIYLDDKKQFSM